MPLRPYLVALLLTAAVSEAATPDGVKGAILRGVRFFHEKAAIHGGYVYRYSADFTLREAEGQPGPDTIWIQPPGTPAVGDAMLEAYLATGEQSCLTAAVDAAHALARTQLIVGGWDYSGDLGPGSRDGKLYLRDTTGLLQVGLRSPMTDEPGWQVWKKRPNGKKTYCTLDDDVTQAATRLLLRVNHALKGSDAEIKQASELAVQTLLRTQYPCGAWSANFDSSSAQPPSAELYPSKPASYPADWPRTWPKDFTGSYVLNDNLHATAIHTLLLAAELNQDSAALAGARRAGDFLLLAQMPDPQPAWAQQYDAGMTPVWSRAFEPSSISGRESQSAMWALIRLAEATGDKKFLSPLPRALAYLKKSLLPNGKLARFYELQTNKPLYFERGKGSKGFVLSYDGSHASSNYGWEWEPELDALQAAHDAVLAGQKPTYPRVEKERWSLPPTDADVDTILSEQNTAGAWAEREGERGMIRNAEGKKTTPAGGVIYSETFVQNIRALCAWLARK